MEFAGVWSLWQLPPLSLVPSTMDFIFTEICDWGHLHSKSLTGNHTDSQMAAWPTGKLLLLNSSVHTCETLTKSNKTPPAPATSYCLRLCILVGKRLVFHSVGFLALLDLIWHHHVLTKIYQKPNFSVWFFLFVFFFCFHVCCASELMVKIHTRVPWNYIVPPTLPALVLSSSHPVLTPIIKTHLKTVSNCFFKDFSILHFPQGSKGGWPREIL